MNNTNIDFKEVMRIRKDNRNPDVTVSPKFKYKDLPNKSYKDNVDIFEDRLNRWHFNVGEHLSEDEIEGSNFTTMILNCIIIDLLSQYYYGLEASQRNKFIAYIRENLKSLNRKLKEPIDSCYYDESGKIWKTVSINDVAEALFYGFRCSLIHSGRISEYGRINKKYKKPITIREWQKGRYEIHINPRELLNRIKKAFGIYVNKLRLNDLVLKENFIKKIKCDYGFDLKD